MKRIEQIEAELTVLRQEYSTLESKRDAITVEERERSQQLYETGMRRRQILQQRRARQDVASDELPTRLALSSLYGPLDSEDVTWTDSAALIRSRAYFEAEIDEGRALVLSGPTGVGKSYAAAAVLKEAGGHFAFWPASCARLLTPDTRDDELKRLRTPHLLVIDDLGMEYSREGSFLEALTDELIWHREGNYCPTIITTNLTPEDMRTRWSSRIIDRLRPSWASVFAVTGESLRK